MSNIVWLDLETTGLEPTRDLILELAAVVTDKDLNEIDRFEAVVGYGKHILERCDVVVLEMHSASKLWREVFGGRTEDLGVVLRRFAHFLDMKVGSEKLPLAGNSVHFDRSFLRVHAPDIEKRFTHRNIDMSSFKEASRRWGGGEPPVSVTTAHRAMADVLDSIEQARWYRKNVWRAEAA